MPPEKRFIVWCPGRCGSILTARVLNHAFYGGMTAIGMIDVEPSHVSQPVIHTHQVEFLLRGLEGYDRIALRRNVFLSAISNLIAKDVLDTHTIETAEKQQKIYEQIGLFELDADRFKNLIIHYGREYQRAASAVQLTYLDYEDFQDDPLRIIRLLKLRPRTPGSLNPDVIRMTFKTPIDKQRQIKNYQQLLDIYADVYKSDRTDRFVDMHRSMS
jgi:hypothetical protein